MEDTYQSLDVTPNFTFTTIQTPSEAANAMIVAILTSFIITGYSHFILKLVTVTHQNTFHFESWLRVHIFSYSDDFIRMMRWILGASPEVNWPTKNRGKSKLHLQRLKWPLIARLLLLLSTLVSIIIAIPRERRMTPCDAGDFHLFLSKEDINNFTPRNGRLAHCDNVLLKSNLGKTRSTLQICKSRYTFRNDILRTLPRKVATSNQSRIISFRWELFDTKETGLFDVGIINKDDSKAVDFTWQALWKGNPENHTLIKQFKTHDFRTPFPRLEKDIIPNMTTLIRDSLGSICSNLELIDRDDNLEYLYYGLNCGDESNVKLLARLEARFNSRIGWEKKDEESIRIPVTRNDVGKGVRVCPIHVSVERPIVNMFPLLLMWILMVVLNLVINWHLRNRSSVLDEVYLLLKDTLGYDMTLNPLQVESGVPLQLKKAKCERCENHYVGYLRWSNNEEVGQLDEQALSSCTCETRCLHRATPAQSISTCDESNGSV